MVKAQATISHITGLVFERYFNFVFCKHHIRSSSLILKAGSLEKRFTTF